MWARVRCWSENCSWNWELPGGVSADLLKVQGSVGISGVIFIASYASGNIFICLSPDNWQHDTYFDLWWMENGLKFFNFVNGGQAVNCAWINSLVGKSRNWVKDPKIRPPSGLKSKQKNSFGILKKRNIIRIEKRKGKKCLSLHRCFIWFVDELNGLLEKELDWKLLNRVLRRKL